LLEKTRREYGGARQLPPVPFFLFGMGERQKFLYRQGVLLDARTGKELHSWEVARELIVPPAYTVALETKEGRQVFLQEDEQGIWLEELGQRKSLAQGRVSLPEFSDRRFGPVLRVLHQELLVNVV